MTTVDKLLIKGIRSFHPNNESTIVFFKPLTLIVGPNGAGKTTIIECLKMATTGEMPPYARSGQSFVMDPKVAGESEVKAQIRLKFTDAAGRSIVVARSFQLSEKKTQKSQNTRSEFKTIDSVLQAYDKETKEKSVLTHRCSDLDKQVPEVMGVSKAILENVIFCHQEDSNWPLEDPKTLKEKFDDIFAATRYTKALEAIRSFKTKQVQEIKSLELQLNTLTAHKDQAHKLRLNVQTDEGHVVSLQTQLAEKVQSLQAIENGKAELNAFVRRYSEDQQVLRALEAERDSLIRERLRIANTVAEMLTDSDEAIAEFVNDFETHNTQLHNMIEGLDQENNRHSVELEALQEMCSKESATVGKLTGEAENNARHAKERDRMLLDLCRKYEIGGFQMAPFSPDQVKKFLDALEGKKIQRREELQKVKADNRRSEDDVSSKMAQLQVKINTISESIRIKQRQKDDLKNMEKNAKAELAQLSVSSEDVAAAKMEEEMAAEELNKLKEELQKADWDQQLGALDRDLNSLRAQLRTLKVEENGLNDQHTATLKIEMKDKELQEKQSKYTAMFNQVRPTAEGLVQASRPGSALTADVLEGLISPLIGRKKQSVRVVASRKDEAGEKVATVKANLKFKSRDLDRIRSEWTEKKEQYRRDLPEDARTDTHTRDFHDLLKEKELQSLEADKAATKAESFEIFMRQFLKLSTSYPVPHCPLCERDFATDQEHKEFEETLMEKLAGAPKFVQDTLAKAAKMKADLAAMRQLETVAADIKRLEEELPQREAEVQALKAQDKEAHEQLSSVEVELEAAQKEESTVVSLLAEARNISVLVRECDRLKREIDAERQSLREYSSQRTIEEVRAEVQRIEDRIADITKRRESVMRDKQRRQEEVNRLELRFRDARQEHQRLQGQLQRRESIVRNIADYAASDRELSSDMEREQDNFEPLKRQIGELELQRAEIRDQNQKREEEALAHMRQIESEQQQLGMQHRAVTVYLGSGKENELKRLQESIAQKQQNVVRLRGDIEAKTAEARQLRIQVAEQATVKRNAEDNLVLRQQQKMIAEKERQIAAKRGEIRNREEFDGIVKVLEESEEKAKMLSHEKGKLTGAINTYNSKISQNRTELKSSIYTNIDEKHRDYLIKVKTTEMAKGDLEKYHAALDRALMKFHGMKMDEINRIIKELWQQTYRGNDIDTIEIRADFEGQAQRSYNYRVVMIKNGAELDMRGRCSAGQKVLASLIIRVALSETFCLNCGILALDEPTTNLDRANIESFANALVHIVKARSAQVNFQLIVITHDEDFVTLLGQREVAEYYYRISKDEGGFSAIRQLPVENLG